MSSNKYLSGPESYREFQETGPWSTVSLSFIIFYTCTLPRFIKETNSNIWKMAFCPPYENKYDIKTNKEHDQFV